MLTSFKSNLIAPCGMNCGICYAYLREKNKCPGCRATSDRKPITRVRCKIKICEVFNNGKSKYCFQCKTFPCDYLNRLDKRYRTKYNMSMLENLGHIKEFGIRKFLLSERNRWTCTNCGGIICVHKKSCSDCGNKLK